MFDVVFISYNEPNADKNYQHLLEIMPLAKRIDKIEGIANAHIEAAKIVNTSHFFTIDGDNEVIDSFDWNNIPNFQKNDERIHVWKCKNPVNGLIYGYGGIKLWPKNHVNNIQEYSTDFTTSVATKGFILHNKIASITRFNTSSFDSWKSGFRECAKLASGIIDNFEINRSRLLSWISIGRDSSFGQSCIHGSRCGAEYGLLNKDNPQALSLINNFEWLKEQYHYLFLKKEIHNFDTAMKTFVEYPVIFTSNQCRFIKEIMNSL